MFKLCTPRGALALAALLLPLSFAACAKTPKAGKKLRVLFVGNSLTYINDLPGVTAALARARNSTLDYDMYAPGGYTLNQHSADPQLLAKIKLGNWDYVVLQEQSEMPAFPWAGTQVLPYARKLASLITEANPGGRTAFYETMARKYGEHEHNPPPELATYEGMQAKLNESYARMAAENNGVLLPVGEAWQKARAGHPEINLYGDDVHPNLAGTYLAACVVYAVLFGDDPEGLPPAQGLDANTAGLLQKTANEITSAPKSVQ